MQSEPQEEEEVDYPTEIEGLASPVGDGVLENPPEEAKGDAQEVRVSLPLEQIYVTSEFGPREDPITGKKKIHQGLDLEASSECPMSMFPGVVSAVGFNKVAGNFVTLQHGELTVTYCHLSKIYVKKGQAVEAGAKIGLTGDTGRATGEHLHLTCKLGNEYIDPYIIITIISNALEGTSDKQ